MEDSGAVLKIFRNILQNDKLELQFWYDNNF